MSSFALVQPRKVERRAKGRVVQFELARVLTAGGRRVTGGFGDEREVEVCEAHIRFVRERGANVALRGDCVASSKGERSERVAGRRDLRIDREGLSKPRFGTGQIVAIETDFAELVVHPRVFRVHPQVVLVSRLRRFVLPQARGTRSPC